MNIVIKVKMDTKTMYDFLLYHTYHSMTGVAGTVFGLLCFALAILTHKTASQTNLMIYILFGIIFLVYLPVNLYFRAVKQLKLNPVFKKPLTYTLSDCGLETAQGEQKELVEWGNLYKTAETAKSILVYTNRKYSFVLPKKDMEDVRQVREMFRKHLTEKQTKQLKK